MTRKINIIPEAQVSNTEDGYIELTIGPAGNQKTFKAAEFMPGLTLLNIMRMSSEAADEGKSQDTLINIVFDFFNSIFEEEERKAFFDYCLDPANKIRTEDIFDIFNKLFEVYTSDRPTNG
jgi:hypothetical protein